MSAWKVSEKQEAWDAVFDRAWSGEPQFVSRDELRTVVVISLQSYEAAQCARRRKVSRNPKLVFTISDANLFGDDSTAWEACNDGVSAIL